MNYYLFTPLINGHDQLRFDEIDDEVTVMFEVGHQISHRSLAAKEWRDSRPLPIHDCPAMSYGVFALSERAWSVLECLLSQDVQAISLEGLSEPYFAINVLSVLPALDIKSSKVTLFRNGRVNRILKHSFYPEVVRGHHMFRIPERHCDTYVSEQLIEMAISSGLKGFVKNKPVFRIKN